MASFEIRDGVFENGVLTARSADGRQLILRSKRQQHISGHPAETRVAGIDVNHAIHYHGARSIHRPAFSLDSVYGGVLLCSVEVPENFPVFTGKCPHVAVD